MSEISIDPEDLDSSLDRADLERSPMKIVRDNTDAEWTLHSVILSDSSETALYLLGHRSTHSDSGELILEERYFVVDLEDPRESGWTDNGISRRISRMGTLIGLRIAYSALSDELSGGLDSQTLSIAAKNGSVDHSPESLEDPISEQLDLPESWRDSEQEQTETAAPGMVICRGCSQEISKSEAVKFGSGDLGDFYVHANGCPSDE